MTMIEFAAARENMIESQVRPNGITDRRIIDAMAGLAREAFVPADCRSIAYMDEDVPLGVPGRHLMEAMAFARLVQLAQVKSGDRVLCVGAGSGYGAAVLASLAREVVAVEQDAGLASRARANLTDLAHVKVVEASPTEGSAADAPFDVILIEGRVAEVPQALLGQLAPGGRLVAVVGETDMARMRVFTMGARELTMREAFDASVSPLPGFEKQRPAFVF